MTMHLYHRMGLGLFVVAILTLAAWHGNQPVETKAVSAQAGLRVGFGAADITPKLEPNKSVYIAGFGHNRVATGVNDPLMARTVVLADGERKIALVSIDVVGFFYPNVRNVRKLLADYHYVLVSSTHSHEGPDTIGLWGPNPLRSGADPAYLKFVEAKIAESVRAAEKTLQPAQAKFGSVKIPELLADSRQPYVLHDDLVTLQFVSPTEPGKSLGILVQWNCHPETLSSKNTLLSADYVGYTVKHLEKQHHCPVAYFTGTVGGLLSSLGVRIKDDQGKLLSNGTFEKTERYGVELGRAADRALAGGQPVALTPLVVKSREIFVPMTNPLYHMGRQLGVVEREAFEWTGDIYQAKPATRQTRMDALCIATEVALLRLGDVEIACIPGEIYPEIVLNKVQEPVDPGADHPNAPLEPAIYDQMRSKHKMLIGLANDEIGYILPKRQWDEKPPYCYGLKRKQYGEENSVGPEAGPVICRAFQELVRGK
jgi:hypothetical protein